MQLSCNTYHAVGYQVNWKVVGRREGAGGDCSEGNLTWWSVFAEFTYSERQDIHGLTKASIVH